MKAVILTTVRLIGSCLTLSANGFQLRCQYQFQACLRANYPVGECRIQYQQRMESCRAC
jgi:hypothetical protein